MQKEVVSSDLFTILLKTFLVIILHGVVDDFSNKNFTNCPNTSYDITQRFWFESVVFVDLYSIVNNNMHFSS